MNKGRNLSVGAALLGVIILDGCGSSNPTCSGSDTLSTLRQIADEKHLAETLYGLKDGEIGIYGQTGNYEFVDVVTMDQTSRKATCKCKVKTTITPKDGEKIIKVIPFDILFEAEKTDEGKLLVTEHCF